MFREKRGGQGGRGRNESGGRPTYSNLVQKWRGKTHPGAMRRAAKGLDRLTGKKRAKHRNEMELKNAARKGRKFNFRRVCSLEGQHQI